MKEQDWITQLIDVIWKLGGVGLLIFGLLTGFRIWAKERGSESSAIKKIKEENEQKQKQYEAEHQRIRTEVEQFKKEHNNIKEDLESIEKKYEKLIETILHNFPFKN